MNKKDHFESNVACNRFCLLSSAFGLCGRNAVIFAALLALGAAARIYGAWELRHHLNPDSGIVALMAKHMAEGTDFPVFFYGQAYMGSLEPLVSALFCNLFGVSGFMIALGTAFVGLLILPAVFLWGRDAHSAKAGLIAMAYCVIGPLGFLHYQLSPRGGYPVTILLGTLILWLTAKLIIGSRKSAADYGKWFLLGLLAGLGWWSNQLITGAILGAALLGLFFLRKKIFSVNTLSAAIGFLAGSLPFWWWNFFNGWRSFEFAGSLGQTPFRTGLKIFFLERLPDLLDLNQGPIVWRIVLAACFTGATVWALAVTRRAVKKQAASRLHLLALFVFILVSILLFSTSHFAAMNTSRYLLPLVPAVAVILGIATAELSGKIPLHYALIPLVLMIVAQLGCMRGMARRGAGEEQYQRQIEECGRLLKARGIGACYAPYGKHGWNFALREEVCFCDLPLDRYKPYARRAELADRIAVFDNLGDINNFISNYCGSAKIDYSGDTPVCWDFNPPREGLAAITPADIESIRDSLDRDILSVVTDGNLDTCWESEVARGDSEWLEISFKTPQKIGMVRLLFEYYPESWQMAGQLEDGCDKILTPEIQTAGYIWSGPRPYWSYGLSGYRLECRLAPESLRSLRIHRIETGWRLAEIQLFKAGPEQADEVFAEPSVAKEGFQAKEGEQSALGRLLGVIRERNLKRLYCDRWPANAIFRETQGAVQTSLDPDNFEGCPAVLSNKVWFTPRTGLLVRREDEALCRRTLDSRMIAMRRTEIGPWVLLDFAPMLGPSARSAKSARRASQDEPGKWKAEYGREFGLAWAGFACLAKNNKLWAEEQQLQPQIKTEIRFNNGIVFSGISLSTNALPAGTAFTIRYFWQYPEKAGDENICAFVHFINGEHMMQDDHPPAKLNGSENQLFDDLLVETRRLFVPETARAGEYSIRIGLYDSSRQDQKRVPVKTALPNRLNAVDLPVKLTVSK
jgi:hypothetical protein